ncbi:MAG: hypothetical protein PVSMB11_05030 [Desulfuromonadaceae bacterium]
MAESRILLDTNAYFRLAQSIRPLLNAAFGEKNYTLYVLKELQDEYEKSPRLTNQFAWVNDPEYVNNRSQRLVVTVEEKAEIKRAYDFILDYVRNVHPGVSKVDVLGLAYAEQLGIPVVTDDDEMRQAAKDYGIKTMKTLELLRLMLDCNHIEMAMVREIAAYWVYMKDTPKYFKADFKKLFGEEPPQ